MGIETLVEAASILARRGRSFRVLLGGGGSQREMLEQLVARRGIPDRVHFLGRIPEETLGAAYAAADCFVLPTRALECFGLIVLEAWSAGTPVIASRVAAIPELVERQGDEWLFPPGHADELADRMEKFLDGRLPNPSNLRSVAEEFDRRRVLDEWMEMAFSDHAPETLAAVS
jgi:glycosyltransferase involved in cell wall biosynthesis